MKKRLPLLFMLMWACGAIPLHSQTYNVYFGDFHSHTWYSDGNQDQNMSTYTLPVARAMTYAKSSPSMDFLGVSDHNHNEGGLHMTLPYWRSGMHEADSTNQDNTFVAMYGQEWGVISGGGHVLVYGTDKLFGWNTGIYDVFVAKSNYTQLWDSVARYGGFCYLAHPQSGDFGGIFSNPYNALADSVVQGVAVKSGYATSTNTTETDPIASDYSARYHDLLRLGYHVAPCGNQDNHNTTYGRVNQQRTAVLVQSLTRDNVLDALRNRRAYCTEDHNLELRLEVNGHQMGEIFSATSPFTIRIKAYDRDGEHMSSIQLRSGVPGSGVAPTAIASVSGQDSLIVSQSQTLGTTSYYYAYVAEADGQEAWSAPVWITSINAGPPSAFLLTSPPNGATNQSTSGTLSWQASSGATQYDVYLDRNNPPTTIVGGNQIGTTYAYAGLTSSATYYWKVVAKNSFGSVTATGTPWSFGTSAPPPPGAFSQTSPSNGATNQSTSGTLSWQPSSNATAYDVYLDKNNPPATLVSPGQSGTTYAYAGLTTSSTYYWKIVARNAAGSVAATGSPAAFSTVPPAPGTFSASAPSNTAANQPLSGTLTWQSSADAVQYDVYLDLNNPPTTLVSPNQTGTSFAYGTLTAGSTYFWKIVAKNVSGNTTAAGMPWSFSTVPPVPGAFDLSSPSSGAGAQSVSVTLTWQASANAAQYDVYLGTDNPPASIAAANLAGTSYACSGLSNNTTYYWKVVARNFTGSTQAATSPWSFTTVMVPPSPFGLLSPPDAGTDLPTSGMLTWSPSAGATLYDVYLGESNPPTTLASANQTGTSFPFSGLTTSHTFFWTIVAKNNGGNQPSATWSFTTVPPAPGNFALRSPANGQSALPQSDTLVWYGSSNAAVYDIYVDTHNPPSVIASTQAETSLALGDLAAGAVYYWKVVARNPGGTGTSAGAPWVFSTAAFNPPGSFSLTSPPDHDPDRPVSGTLVWESSAFATGYDVYLDTVSPPATIVSQNHIDTTWNFTGLAFHTTYYWSVSAKNNVGSAAAAFSPRSFSTASLPGSFQLISPPDGATGQAVSGTLTWQTSPGAVSYDVCFDTINPPMFMIGSNISGTSLPYGGCTPASRYYWRIVARNQQGTVQASDAPRSFQTASFPPKASDVLVGYVTDKSVALSWHDNAADEQGYRIYRALSAGAPFVQLGGDLPPHSSAYIDTLVISNQRYFYQITAFNSIGEGSPAAIDALTLAAMPGMPLVSAMGYKTARLVLEPSTNSAATAFCLHVNHGGSGYVEADGTIGSTPVWRTMEEWGGSSGILLTGLQACSEYSFSAVAGNEDGIETGMGPSSDLGLACFDVTATLPGGWNLVSVPVTVENLQHAVVFPGGISSAFAFEGGYVSRDALGYGKGYWMKFPDGAPALLSGDPRLSESIALNAGWNLVGSVAQPISASSVQVTPPGIIGSPFFGYDGGYFAADSILPMHGYWLRVQQSGTLTLTSSTPLAKAPAGGRKAVAPPDLFEFSDKCGHHQSLGILGSPAVPAEAGQYVLPPVPPAGSFDVRFASDRSAEARSANGTQGYDVAVQPGGCPVGVRWTCTCSQPHSVRLVGDGKTLSLVNGERVDLPTGAARVRIEVEEAGARPVTYSLGQNYPNPFNPVTHVTYSVAGVQLVTLRVFDVLGREVATLVNETRKPGTYTADWDATNQPSGVYYCRMQAGSFVETKELVLLK